MLYMLKLGFYFLFDKNVWNEFLVLEYPMKSPVSAFPAISKPPSSGVYIHDFFDVCLRPSSNVALLMRRT